MSVESAKQDIKGSYGEGFVIMGTDRIEVSPDGKKTAYTNDGVETKAAQPAPPARERAISDEAVPLSRDGAGGAATQGISISADFNTVVLNGATIERAADDHLVISSPGTVITQPGPANDTAAKAKTVFEIGDEMEDGTIYAGISPDTNKPMYAMPADAPGIYTFNQAAKYAKNLDAHGHHDFHAPTKDELNLLFQNRAAIGGFDVTGSSPAGWYWSSSPHLHYGWVQRFSDGHQNYDFRNYDSSLRCVR